MSKGKWLFLKSERGSERDILKGKELNRIYYEMRT